MQTLYIHPQTPQLRLITQVVSTLNAGKTIVLPTFYGYRFAFGINAKDAFASLTRLGVTESDLCLICSDISAMTEHATIDNTAFATIKATKHTAFVLPAKSPNKHIIRQKTITITTDHTPIVSDVLAQCGSAIFVAPLFFLGQQGLEYWEIADKLDAQAAMFVDVGDIKNDKPMILDLT